MTTVKEKRTKRKAASKSNGEVATKKKKNLNTLKVNKNFRSNAGKKPDKNSKPDLKTDTPLKETAQTRKQRKLLRKQRRPNYELSVKAKKIWEKLRIHKAELSRKEKTKLVDDLTNAVTDENKKLIDLCYAHDTSRVIQTCLKQGNREQREKMFEELKSEVVLLCKNKYAKNVVWKMLKYGTPDERSQVMKVLQSRAYPLMRSTQSATVIEYAYNNYANADQRNSFVRQLYGRVFRNYQISDSGSVADLIAANPAMKSSILDSFKFALSPFVEKLSLKHTLVHKAMKDFFDVCDEAPLRMEMIESLRESIIHMMHTREGAHVSMECLWHGSKKDRKVIIKTMKEFVEKLCCEEFGHLVVLAAFDCVDDTVLTKKALIQPLMRNIDALIRDKYGRKVLLYLTTFRSSSHFVPDIVKVLSNGDENASSKKPMEQRRRELIEAASPEMIKYVARNMEEFVYSRSLFVFVDAAFFNCSGNTSPISQSLVDLMRRPYNPEEKDESERMHVVEDPCGHMVIKRLIKGEAELGETNEGLSFSSLLLDEIPRKNLVSWSGCNRGTQILLALVESKNQETSSKVKQLLKKQISTIKKISSFKSTEILLEKLE